MAFIKILFKSYHYYLTPFLPFL